MLLLQGQISQKKKKSGLLAALGSQGIVVKCPAAIFLPYGGIATSLLSTFVFSGDFNGF